MAELENYPTMSNTFYTHDGHRLGRKSNVFQPPRTPSASSSVYIAQSTNSTMTNKQNPLMVNKKRNRQDSMASSIAMPSSQTMDWSTGPTTTDSIANTGFIDRASPMPFVNTRYQLAGGLDTPTAAAAGYYEESEFSDTGFRRNLSDDSSKGPPLFEPEYHSFARLPSSASMESNGKLRIPSQQQPSGGGWSQTALNAVGSVVGRVWQFCKAGAFSGFSAGGGQQYQLDAYHTIATELGNQNDGEFWDPKIAQTAAMFEDTSGRAFTPLTGQYLGEDSLCIVDGITTPEETPARATKRRQIEIENNNSGLGNNWVVVPNAPAIPTPKPAPRCSIPRRQINSPSSTASRTPVRGGARRSLLHPRPSGVSHAGSPGLRASGPASFASPRSPGGSKIPVPISSMTPFPAVASPSSIEAQKWAAMKRNEELQADKSMSRLNAQLQAMIREGKEALGTKFEVKEIDEVTMEDADAVEGFGSSTFTASTRSRFR